MENYNGQAACVYCNWYDYNIPLTGENWTDEEGTIHWPIKSGYKCPSCKMPNGEMVQYSKEKHTLELPLKIDISELAERNE